MSNVARHITVLKDDDGQRLDRWLKKQGFSFSAAQKIVRTGQVRIDGKRAKADQKLVEGQDVRLPPSELPKQKVKKYTQADREFLQNLIIYEDKDIIALNKPAGLATQGGSGATSRQMVTPPVDGMVPGASPPVLASLLK